MSKSNSLKALIAAGVATLTSITGSSFAQSADQQEMIARADKNGDGNIEWSEITALRMESFDRLDRNKDGIVNADDSPARPLAGRFNEALGKLQADFDSDRDGQITKEEMLNAPAPLFEKGDTNSDGVLTAEERAALKSERIPSE